MGCAAVVQIVPVDRGQHDIAQGHQLDGFRGVLGFFLVQPAVRVAGVHRAETAGAGADRSHEHDGGGAVGPALAHIGAMGFLADRAQAMFADITFDCLKTVTARCLDPQPLGLWRKHLGFSVGATFLAILDGGNALGVAKFFAAGNGLLRGVGHDRQGSW